MHAYICIYLPLLAGFDAHKKDEINFHYIGVTGGRQQTGNRQSKVGNNEWELTGGHGWTGPWQHPSPLKPTGCPWAGLRVGFTRGLPYCPAT